jgi:hypothetical protein
MSQTTIEDRCRGVLIGLAAGGRIGGPIRMALLLAESLLNCGDASRIAGQGVHYLVAPQFTKPGAGLRLTA